MKQFYKWKVLWVPLLLMAAGIFVWPVLAGPSTKLHPLDNMADNIDQAMNANARLEVFAQVHEHLDDINATASWVVITEGTGINLETTHVATHDIANSLSFDKVGGATTAAGYGKTITSMNVSEVAGDSLITFYVQHANYTNFAYVWVRVGTSASHYNQYRADPADFATGEWTHVTIPLHDGIQTGNGLDLSAITYVAIGITTDNVTDVPTNIYFNSLEIHTVTAAEFQITGDVTSNAVRVLRVGSNAGAVWPKDAGNVNNGTPRVVIADDDTNLLAITTAIEGAEDELDGTTTTGPLDDIKAVDEGRVIAASGQHLDNAGAGTAAATYTYQVVVVAGATYRVHAVNGVMYLGILLGSTDANVLWVVGAGQTEIITIPSGTALFYFVDSDGVEGRLARIQ